MLRESEIFNCLEENFRLAAEDCELLARTFRQTHTGHIYTRLREELRLIEGACRQVGHYREHANWFPVGMKAAEAADRVKNFVQHKHPAESFLILARVLRQGLYACQKLRHDRVGRMGMILPTMREAPLRPGKHMTVKLPASPGGILLPGGA